MAPEPVVQWRLKILSDWERICFYTGAVHYGKFFPNGETLTQFMVYKGQVNQHGAE